MGQEIHSKNLSKLKLAAKTLNSQLEQIDLSTLSESEKNILKGTVEISRELFREMESFVDNIVEGLEESGDQLKKNSGKLLKEASERLDKVNESTETAVNSVLNRVDKIVERQNDVFQGISELKDNMAKVDNQNESIQKLMEVVEKLESIENEIQMETFEIMNEMQFQDIASQQIQSVSKLIDEAKAKLTDFRNILALFTGVEVEHKGKAANERVFDPEATMKNREARQLVADEITEKFQEK